VQGIVRDARGREARLRRPAGPGSREATLVLSDGEVLHVPAAWLEPDGGHYRLALAFDELSRGARNARPTHTVPALEEQLEVGKREREEVVRVRKLVHTREERLSQELAREDVEIERVAIGREVSEPPGIRDEGDTLVIPLLEEQIVWRKRLVVREEVRIRKRHRLEPCETRATLRREDVVVEREREP